MTRELRNSPDMVWWGPNEITNPYGVVSRPDCNLMGYLQGSNLPHLGSVHVGRRKNKCSDPELGCVGLCTFVRVRHCRLSFVMSHVGVVAVVVVLGVSLPILLLCRIQLAANGCCHAVLEQFGTFFLSTNWTLGHTWCLSSC